nr:unnamed protein product [Callosobruchus analis]
MLRFISTKCALSRSVITTATRKYLYKSEHENRPNAVPEEITNLIKLHITSLKPREFHYSLRENPNRYYLDERLNVRRMYRMFLDEYKINVSYKAYWSIFHSKFNIKFGLPRRDTCSICDSLRLKEAAENEILKRKGASFEEGTSIL